MNLPAGSELWMIGLGAFLVCLVVLNATARRGDSSSYDELERAGSHNGIRGRRTVARSVRGSRQS